MNEVEREKSSYIELGRLIFKCRKDNGLSTSEFASRILRSQSSIERLEKGVWGLKYDTISDIVKAIVDSENLQIARTDKEKMKDLLRLVRNEVAASKDIRKGQLSNLIIDVNEVLNTMQELARFIKSRELVFTLLEADTEAEKSAKMRISDAIENYRRILSSEELATFRNSADREITDFEAKMKEISSGTQKFRQHSRTRLDQAWASIIEEADYGDVVFATSTVPLEWWRENSVYLRRNANAIKRGVQIVRIFILDKDDLEEIAIRDEGTTRMTIPNQMWRAEMAEHVKMGIQVNWLCNQDLTQPARDFLAACVTVKPADGLHSINNSHKSITDIKIVGEQIIPKGQVEWSELTKSTNPNTISDVRDHLDDYYRKSKRFAYLEWYRDFYDEDYIKIDDVRAKKDTDTEVKQIVNLLLEENSASEQINLLDLGCGYGRLSIPLVAAVKQLHIWGIDVSSKMLKVAERDTPSYLQSRLHFNELDMENLREYLENQNLVGKVDMAISIYTSFGYMSDDSNFQLLEAIAMALKPNGLFLLDLDNKDDFIRKQGEPKVYASGEGWQVKRYDLYYDEMFKRRMSQYVVEQGRTIKVKPLFLTRLYEPNEISHLLEKVGLETINCWQDFSRTEYKIDSERMIIYARKT